MSIYLGNSAISSVYLGSNSVSAVYLGSTQVWTANVIGPNTIYIVGMASTFPTSASLAPKLTGETFTAYNVAGADISAETSTTYTIDAQAFSNNTQLIQFIDGGQCTGVLNSLGASLFGSFYNATNLTTVQIPNAATLGAGSFRNCTSLSTVSLPNVTSTGTSVFQDCTSLTTISLPLVTNISNGAFQGATSLATASFGTVTFIGNNSFAYTNLTNASFNSVTLMGTSPFAFCSSLVTASFNALTVIPTQAFLDCTSLQTASFASATVIQQSAFQGCQSLVSASFPTVLTVGNNAFGECYSLRYVDLSGLNGSTALGGSIFDDTVFSGVPNTGTIRIPSDYLSNRNGQPDQDLSYLRAGALTIFTGRQWTIDYQPTNKIRIDGAAASFPTSASLESSLTGETFTYYQTSGSTVFASSSTNYTIDSQAFAPIYSKPDLQSFIDGGKCTSIGDEAFYYSNIVTASFSHVTSIGNFGFSTTQNLKIANFPRVQSVGQYAFNGAAITEGDFPELTTVGALAFARTRSLLGSTLNLPKATSIPVYMLYDSYVSTLKADSATEVDVTGFNQATYLSYISLRGLTGPNALGGDTIYTGMFTTQPNFGNIVVPNYLSASNGGTLDGDLLYLQNTKGWTISWA